MLPVSDAVAEESSGSEMGLTLTSWALWSGLSDIMTNEKYSERV